MQNARGSLINTNSLKTLQVEPFLPVYGEICGHLYFLRSQSQITPSTTEIITFLDRDYPKQSSGVM